MTAILKCHVNYVHYVMVIMYIPIRNSGRLKTFNAVYYVISIIVRGDYPR